MQYTNMGTSGLRVSRLCLGASPFGDPKLRPWALTAEESFPIVRKAIELGVNFFDTAEIYSWGQSEVVLGKALKEFAEHREDVVVATKVAGGSVENKINRSGLSRKHLMNAVDESLSRLQCDYIDLYQIHRWSDETPIEETLEALNDMVRMGKVRYIGASSMYAWQFERALGVQEKNGWTKFISMQNYYNLIYREEEREMIPLCQERGIGLMPWGALSGGLLAGNLTREGAAQTKRAGVDVLKQMFPPSSQDFDIQDKVREVAARNGISMAQVAVAWVASRPGIQTALFGATKVSQVEDTVAALEIELSTEDVETLEELYKPVTVQGL